MVDTEEPWPLRHLVLRSPRLDLRPDDDAGLFELAGEALRGVHDPAMMPFAVPWTDAPREELGRNTVQFFWSQRAALTPQRWTVNFVVRYEGRAIGMQSLIGADVAVTGQVSTGSWLGRRFQGQGLGTEMRAAVLLFAFDHLGATVARSDAFVDNVASNAVSRKLGYVGDGGDIWARRGEAAQVRRLVLPVGSLVRPQWTLKVDGFGPACRAQLGVE
jgi:RimJ/RimL family protein N-acetyltransferase